MRWGLRIGISMIIGMAGTPNESARADFVYQGTTDSVLTVNSITGGSASNLIAIPSTSHSSSHSATGPGADATASSSASTTVTPPTLAVDDTFSLSATVSGSIPTGALGASDGKGTAGGTLSLFNAGTSTITVDLTLTYRYFLQATTTGAGESSVQVTLDLDKTVAGSTTTLLNLSPVAQGQDGSSMTVQSTGYPLYTSLAVSLEVGAGQSASLTLSSDMSGSALVTAVPEPSSLTLIGLAMTMVLPPTIRRRRSSAC